MHTHSWLHDLEWSGIGYVAGTFSILFLITNIIKLKKEKNLEGVSLLTYVIYSVSCLVWIIWAALAWAYNDQQWVKNLIVIVPNFISFLFANTIIILKILNDRQRTKLNDIQRKKLNDIQRKKGVI
jgi:uncharacterized protein with PQ loop repeat